MSNRRPMSMHIDKDAYNHMNWIAEREERSFSQQVRYFLNLAIRKYLENTEHGWNVCRKCGEILSSCMCDVEENEHGIKVK